MECVQCKQPADVHISWLAKKSMTEDEPQECDICNECMTILWNKYKNTQFGQTINIEPA